MSHSRPSANQQQPTFPTPPTGLICPICGGRTVASWWVADLLLCEHCYWSGRATACKLAINDSNNVLHAGGDTDVAR